MNKKHFRATDGPMIMLIAFALMLVAQLITSFVIIGVGEVSSEIDEIINCVGMILFQLVYFATFLVYIKKNNVASSFSPKNKISVWGIVGALPIALTCFFGFIGLAYYFEYLLAGVGYSSPGLEVNSTVGIVLLIVATVIAAPICEETIFRNALLSGISKVRRDELGACVISGLCFALMHINPSQTVYQFCLGTVAAFVTLKCRSVLPAMIVHALSNAFALILSYMDFGLAVEGFYAQTGNNLGITLVTCILLPVSAIILIWLLLKYINKVEKSSYPDKFKLEPKVIWIDENTKQPIFEGGSAPTITDENRLIQKGFSPFSGAPVFVDRLELQKELMEEYEANNGQKAGVFGKKSYRIAFAVYLGITCFMWILTFLAGLVS